MQDFDHPNVMQLVGICWAKQENVDLRPFAPLIVLPYMELGDLKTYLRKSRPRRESDKVNKRPENDSCITVHLY